MMTCQTAISFSFDPDKTEQAITYIAAKCSGGVEKGKLCKLLFLADKYHLVRYGRTITGDSYYALPHGPVPTKTLDLLNTVLQNPDGAPALSGVLRIDHTFQYPRFSANSLSEWDNLSRSDREALDETIKRFGGKTFSELRSITHEMVAYICAWERRESSPMAFEDFFEEDSDAIAGVLEEAVEDSKLRKAFPAR